MWIANPNSPGATNEGSGGPSAHVLTVYTGSPVLEPGSRDGDPPSLRPSSSDLRLPPRSLPKRGDNRMWFLKAGAGPDGNMLSPGITAEAPHPGAHLSASEHRQKWSQGHQALIPLFRERAQQVTSLAESRQVLATVKLPAGDEVDTRWQLPSRKWQLSSSLSDDLKAAPRRGVTRGSLMLHPGAL